jgi:hypothetical protein
MLDEGLRMRRTTGISFADSPRGRVARIAGTGRLAQVKFYLDRDDFIAATLAAYESQTPHARVLILTRSLPNDRFSAIAAALCGYAAEFPNGMQSYTVDFLTPAEAG